jgi:hypothetical protein
MLDDEVPLIGFAGSPWTIMCYAWKDKDLKVLIKQKDFVLAIQKQHVLCKNHRYDYSIFTRKKVKAGVDAVQVLILGAECCLQLIIKNSLGNTSIRLSSFGRSCSSNCFGKDVGLPLMKWAKVVLLH